MAAVLHLERTEENVAEIDALAGLLGARGGGRIGVEGLLGELGRRARRTAAPHPRLLGLAVSRALTWEAADRRDQNWWPQGISNSAHTGVDREVLVVSWYAKNDQGSRVSVLDLAAKRYDHVLLVTPTVVDGRPGTRPLKVHAGGIVWHGPYLHVAATGKGFLTCRMDDLMRVPEGSPLETYGHRYLLPVRFAYKAVTDEGYERLRYSFMSLDRSADPPELLVGEYGNAKQTRRIARFPTADDSCLLATDDDGRSRPALVDQPGATRMQGAVVVDGTYYVTTSHGPWTPGSVHVGTPGAFRRRRWATPIGPEDLAWWGNQGLLWSVTEHPRRRWIVGMAKSRLDG